MTSDARGTPATPFEVSINVNIIVICWPNDMCQPIVVSAAWATKTDAIARYRVDPVRLNEYPVGITNPTTYGGTPKRSIDSIAACRSKCERGRLAHRTYELSQRNPRDPNHQSENQNDKN